LRFSNPFRLLSYLIVAALYPESAGEFVEESTFIRSVTLFLEFDDEELAAVGRSMVMSRFAEGDAILEEGNANRALHVLRSGRIRVSRRVGDSEVSLCDLVAGQTFGELSIIEDGVASATLRAVSETEILSMPMQSLAQFLHEHPAAASKFWRAIAVELRRRLLQTNDVVSSYFEINRNLVENPTFREAYAMCNR
jgi:CRP/FNR family transcriptional regulator, cyclic AMP receptor protein